MKRLLVSLLVGLSAMALLTGCSWSISGGRKISTSSSDEHPAVGQQLTTPTLGQQLIDLQKAKDSGAMTDAEYQTQKAKLLENK